MQRTRPAEYRLPPVTEERLVAWLDAHRLFTCHMQQVAFLSLELFCELEWLHGEPPASARLLHAAALTHDVGYAVMARSHHKHARDLILENPIPGFEEIENQAIACLARYHRKADPSTRHRHFAELPPELRQTVRHAAALMRVADGLDRSHLALVRAVAARVEADRISLRLSLPAHTDPAMDLWGAERKKRYFEELYGHRLDFEIEEKAHD